MSHSGSFLNLVQKRQSVRRYSDSPVEEEKIFRCLESARMAPSASNSQPWSFILVNEPLLKEHVAEATYGGGLNFNKFVPQAPVIIVIVVEKPKLITRIGAMMKKRPFEWIDTGIAAEHICLQAAEEGLGTCMLGWFDEKRIARLLAVPSSKRIGLMITMGYPEKDYLQRIKIRKSAYTIYRKNSYVSPWSGV